MLLFYLIITVVDYALNVKAFAISLGKRECHLNQNTYNVGATWTASDGCNLCSCTDTGVHCTNHHCQVAG